MYYLLGRTYYEKTVAAKDDGEAKKNAAEAVKYFDRIKHEFPESALINQAQFRKANVYYALGQYKKAIETANEAVSVTGDKKFAMLVRYFISWNYYMDGEYLKAVEGYDGVISSDSRDMLSVWAEYKKGLCFEALKRDQEALASYRSVSATA